MHNEDYIREKTGLLLVDPYNDFLSPTGKLWPQAKEVAEEVNLLSNLKSIVDAARQSGVRIFVVPHHRWEPGDYEHWKYPHARQLKGAENRVFEKGGWGGDWHPDFIPEEGDIIVKEHWAQAALPIRISTSSSNNTALIKLSSSGCSQIRVLRRPGVLEWNSVTT